jgi:invasion protein IalB
MRQSKRRTTYYKTGVISTFLLFGIDFPYAQQRTSAVYEDWTLSCAIVSGANAAKSCGLVQVQKNSGQGAAVSQIGFGRNTKADPLKMSIEVNANTWISPGVKLFASAGAPAITAQFRWCISTRCLADVDLSEADVKNLRGQQERGRILYKDASQVDVSIPVSFKGFSEALNALEQQ